MGRLSTAKSAAMASGGRGCPESCELTDPPAMPHHCISTKAHACCNTLYIQMSLNLHSCMHIGRAKHPALPLKNSQRPCQAAVE